MGEVFSQLVPAFIEQSDELVSEMPNVLANGAIDVLQRHAHSMKSSSLNVGAETLSEIAKTLEQMSRDNEAQDLLKEKVELITDEYVRVKAELQKYL